MKERFKLVPAVVLFIRRGNEILLGKRCNTGWQDGKWGLFGGGVDGAETVRQAAVREAYEELGIAIDIEHLKVIHVLHHNFYKKCRYKWSCIPLYRDNSRISNLYNSHVSN